MQNLLKSLFFFFGRGVFWLLGGVKFEGTENIPKTGPVLLVANHLSDIDPPVMIRAIPRPAWYMAKSELFTTRLLGIPIGPIMRLFQAFPVRQETADRAALRFSEELLNRGEALVLFPEGHLSETGEMVSFQPGAAMIALRTGAPVVPVGIIDTPEMLPYGKLVPRRSSRPVQVRFGPPISLEDLSSLPRQQALRMATRRMEEAVALLAEQPLPAPSDKGSSKDAYPPGEKLMAAGSSDAE